MSDLTLFDALRARDEAMARVDEAADSVWKDQALEAIRVTCEQLHEFHVDDVWKIGELERTREDRALGPQMRRAAALGWCRKTDRVRPSIRSHGSGKPVWVSLLYDASKETAA